MLIGVMYGGSSKGLAGVGRGAGGGRGFEVEMVGGGGYRSTIGPLLKVGPVRQFLFLWYGDTDHLEVD